MISQYKRYKKNNKKCFLELMISQYKRYKKNNKKMFLRINDITIQEVKEKQQKMFLRINDITIQEVKEKQQKMFLRINDITIRQANGKFNVNFEFWILVFESLFSATIIFFLFFSNLKGASFQKQYMCTECIISRDINIKDEYGMSNKLLYEMNEANICQMFSQQELNTYSLYILHIKLFPQAVKERYT